MTGAPDNQKSNTGAQTVLKYVDKKEILMKTKILALSFIAAIAFGAVSALAHDGCPQCSGSASTATTPSASQKYTCPMHPEVVSDKAGKCPKCGMKLVPVKEAASPKK